ncbi:MAG TPA: Ig-like domain-containing protein [Gemmatimonadaceae bacterium]|nr:Ig-like domain-containing protein [Gemmatimonadaceae bacterium]
MRKLFRSFLSLATVTVAAGGGLSACGSGGGEKTPTDPIQQAPASVQANTPTTSSAPVASAITIGVTVRDASGNPVAGAGVSFEVMSGGGSLSPSVALTNGSGSATTQWTLGKAAGANQVSVTVGNLSKVTFNATGVPGAVVSLEKVGDLQEGAAGAPLASPLRVKALDTHGNAVPGTTVTFAVTAGGGSLQSSSATTDVNGFATAGLWTLGSGAADQAVTASVGAITTVFTAKLSSACASTAINVGASVNGALSSNDCQIAGRPADVYSLVNTATQLVAITLKPTGFTGKITVSAGGEIATSDQVVASGTPRCVFPAPADGCHSPSVSKADDPVTILSPASSRSVTVTSTGAALEGSYVLSTEQSAANISGCRTVFVERNIATNQQLESSDCHAVYGGGNPTYYSDDVKIFLTAGSNVTVTMASTAFTPFLDIFAPNGSYAGGCAGVDLSTGCIIKPTATGYYLLGFSALQASTGGAYSLNIQ